MAVWRSSSRDFTEDAGFASQTPLSVRKFVIEDEGETRHFLHRELHLPEWLANPNSARVQLYSGGGYTCGWYRQPAGGMEASRQSHRDTTGRVHEGAGGERVRPQEATDGRLIGFRARGSPRGDTSAIRRAGCIIRTIRVYTVKYTTPSHADVVECHTRGARSTLQPGAPPTVYDGFHGILEAGSGPLRPCPKIPAKLRRSVSTKNHSS